MKTWVAALPVRPRRSKDNDSIRVLKHQQHMTAVVPAEACMPMFSSDAQLQNDSSQAKALGHNPKVTTKEAWRLIEGIMVADHRGSPPFILQTDEGSRIRSLSLPGVCYGVGAAFVQSRLML